MTFAMSRRRAAASLVSLLALAAFSATGRAQSELGSPRRIRQVKAALGVRDTQSGAWSDYVAALEAYRAAVREVREAEIQLMGGTHAIDGSDDALLRDRQTARLMAKADLKSSYEAFYGVLDGAQQRIADATLTAGECGR